MVHPSSSKSQPRLHSYIKGNRVSSTGDTRTVWLGVGDVPGGKNNFPDNRVISAKYTLWNFLPKNLFEQFRRVANFYFLCISIISLSIESPVSPVTTVFPLVFVIMLTTVKQGYEDWLRHCSDREVNSTLVTVIRNGCAQQIKSKLVCVGDLVQVRCDEDIPCDLILLASSNHEGRCHVITANLDGETNLKILLCPRLLRYFSRPEQLANLRAQVECEQPTPDLYKFYGKIEIFPEDALQLYGDLGLGQTISQHVSPLQRTSHFEDDVFSRNSSGSLRSGTVVQPLEDSKRNNGSLIRRTSLHSVRTSVVSAEDMTRRNSNIRVDAPLGHNSLKSVRLSQLNDDDPTRRYSVGMSAPLGTENLLLRGTRLKNTEFIYGCAVYTGQETKLALNSKLTSNKFSTVEKSINRFLLFFLGFLIFAVGFCLILKYTLEERKSEELQSYLGETLQLDVGTFVQDLFSFFILYNYIIPISLYVMIETQKFLGTLFFEWDLELYCKDTGQAAICNTSDLNEELGQVQYLFTDKTGTLTENNMQFRRCSVGGVAYLENNGSLFVLAPNGSEHNGSLLETYNAELEQFLLAMALCHSVQPSTSGTNNNVTSEMKLDYQASSPDEKALVEASARCGVVFLGEDGDFMSIHIKGRVCRYRKLDVLEFTSDRKRMSVVVEDEAGEIWLYCKGAESAVIPLSEMQPSNQLQLHITDFAMRGLRTMVVACKRIDAVQYNLMSHHVENARQTLSTRRESVLAASYAKMEAGVSLLGATGVEDQLQEGVQETLESLRAAGIKVWILTGDKVETAVNISHSCGHFKSGTEQLYLTGHKSEDACLEALHAFRNRVNEERLKQFGLVVDGRSLGFALKHPVTFREVCMVCSAIICCRMSPLQKCQVVQLMKSSPQKPITAAIGDGANDVSMIQEAHVGMGIMGKEGRQAVRCSDFAFARFKFVQRVLLVHGHWYYERISTLVQYFFYKNVVFIMPQMYYAFHNAFSTQALYDSLFLTLYNVLFTSLPILIYGQFEQIHSAEKLLRYPQLYLDISHNVHMTWSCFMQWIAFGVWHALVLYFIPYFMLSINPVLLIDNQPVEDLAFGSLIFHSVVVVANLKLWMHSCFWTWIFLGSIFLSILGFMAIAAIYCSIHTVDGSMYFVYLKIFISPSFWLISLLLAVTCLIPDLSFTVLKHYTASFCGKIQRMWHRKHGRPYISVFSKRKGHITITGSSNLC